MAINVRSTMHFFKEYFAEAFVALQYQIFRFYFYSALISVTGSLMQENAVARLT